MAQSRKPDCETRSRRSRRHGRSGASAGRKRCAPALVGGWKIVDRDCCQARPCQPRTFRAAEAGQTGARREIRRSRKGVEQGRTGPVAAISTPTIINDVPVGDNQAQAKRLTDINEKLFAALDLTPPRKSGYGQFRRIPGLCQKPPDFDAKKQCPLILNIHSELPHTAYGYVFFHEMRWMAVERLCRAVPEPARQRTGGEEFANIIQFEFQATLLQT